MMDSKLFGNDSLSFQDWWPATFEPPPKHTHTSPPHRSLWQLAESEQFTTKLTTFNTECLEHNSFCQSGRRGLRWLCPHYGDKKIYESSRQSGSYQNQNRLDSDHPFSKRFPTETKPKSAFMEDFVTVCWVLSQIWFYSLKMYKNSTD